MGFLVEVQGLGMRIRDFGLVVVMSIGFGVGELDL